MPFVQRPYCEMRLRRVDLPEPFSPTMMLTPGLKPHDVPLGQRSATWHNGVLVLSVIVTFVSIMFEIRVCLLNHT